MKIRTGLAALVCALSLLPACGSVEWLCLQEWVGGDRPLPGGWTQHKLNKGDGGAYFNSKDGWLQSPVFGAAIRTVKIEIYSTSPTPTRIPHLHPIVNGVTNEQGEVVLPTEKQAYAMQEFALEQRGANQFVIKFAPGGSSGNWWIRKVEVRFGDSGTDDEDVPRSLSLSTFVPRPGCRVFDFAELGYVKPGTENPWRNGLTVEGFHAFSDGGPCENIRFGTAKSTQNGLYALTNEAVGSACALSLLGTSGSAMRLMLPMALDTERPLTRLSVGYRVRELSADGKSTTLSFSYRTLDDLAAMSADDADWTPVPEAGWSTGDGDSARAVELPVKNLRGAKFVCLRWCVPKKGSSSIVGVTDMRVTGAVIASGFVFSIR